jgi:methenyltetrahydromethanopterin cyclohydrolase
LRAGIHLAEICLAGLAEIKLVPGTFGQSVNVYTDHPVTACLGSQYAGWQVSVGDYFAMGSGPMRAACGNEAIIQEIGGVEQAEHVVGVLESNKLPSDEVCERIAADCGVKPNNVILCVARTASLAGTVQVVARSVETAMHKIHELGFDINKVQSGFGNAPLPPIAATDLVGIGRTNDAVLYGGEVTLWIRAEDDELTELVEHIPSKASRDFGVPFAEIFQKYDGDFYKIDPHLFSPAKVCLVNLNSGRSFSAGEFRDDLLAQSFYS